MITCQAFHLKSVISSQILYQCIQRSCIMSSTLKTKLIQLEKFIFFPSSLKTKFLNAIGWFYVMFHIGWNQASKKLPDTVICSAKVAFTCSLFQNNLFLHLSYCKKVHLRTQQLTFYPVTYRLIFFQCNTEKLMLIKSFTSTREKASICEPFEI